MLESAGLVGNRPGERAADVTEQFGLDQFLWYGGTVDFDERPALAAAALVDQSRHQLLARAVIAENQDAAVGRRGQCHLLPQMRHGGAIADHRVVLLAIDLGAQHAVFGLEVALSQRVADHQHRLLQRQRLLDEVEGAHLDGAHRRLDVAVAGNDHHLRIDLPLAQALEGGQAIEARQPDVEHDDVVGIAVGPLQALFARADGVHVEAFVLEDAADR